MNPRSKASIPKDAGKRRVSAVGGQGGHWFTGQDGRKVFAARLNNLDSVNDLTLFNLKKILRCSYYIFCHMYLEVCPVWSIKMCLFVYIIRYIFQKFSFSYSQLWFFATGLHL